MRDLNGFFDHIEKCTDGIIGKHDKERVLSLRGKSNAEIAQGLLFANNCIVYFSDSSGSLLTVFDAIVKDVCEEDGLNWLELKNKADEQLCEITGKKHEWNDYSHLFKEKPKHEIKSDIEYREELDKIFLLPNRKALSKIYSFMNDALWAGEEEKNWDHVDKIVNYFLTCKVESPDLLLGMIVNVAKVRRHLKNYERLAKSFYDAIIQEDGEERWNQYYTHNTLFEGIDFKKSTKGE